MKYSVDCKEFTIYRNKKIHESYVKICKNAHQKNKKLFKKVLKHYNIYIIENNDEMKKYSGLTLNLDNVSGAATAKGRLAIRSPAFLAKQPYTTANRFKRVMIHEINHIFWKQPYKDWKPTWLCEGLANNVCEEFIWPKNHKYAASDYPQDHKFLEYR